MKLQERQVGFCSAHQLGNSPKVEHKKETMSANIKVISYWYFVTNKTLIPKLHAGVKKERGFIDVIYFCLYITKQILMIPKFIFKIFFRYEIKKSLEYFTCIPNHWHLKHTLSRKIIYLWFPIGSTQFGNIVPKDGEKLIQKEGERDSRSKINKKQAKQDTNINVLWDLSSVRISLLLHANRV